MVRIDLLGGVNTMFICMLVSSCQHAWTDVWPRDVGPGVVSTTKAPWHPCHNEMVGVVGSAVAATSASSRAVATKAIVPDDNNNNLESGLPQLKDARDVMQKVQASLPPKDQMWSQAVSKEWQHNVTSQALAVVHRRHEGRMEAYLVEIFTSPHLPP